MDVSYPGKRNRRKLVWPRTITHDLAAPPLYTLVGMNCTAWVVHNSRPKRSTMPETTNGRAFNQTSTIVDSEMNFFKTKPPARASRILGVQSEPAAYGEG